MNEVTTAARVEISTGEGAHGRWLARGLWALALVFIAAGLIFLSTNPNTDIGERFGFRGNDALIGLVYATVGLLIASRQPRNLVGWLFLLLGLDQVIEFLITEYATYALLAFPGSLPAGAVMAWLQNFLWPIGLVILYFVLPLIFPQGRLPSPRWRWLVGLSLVAAAAQSLGLAILPLR